MVQVESQADMSKPIASQQIFSVSPKHGEKVLILKIWAPDLRSEDEWQCRWEIEGLYGTAHPAVSNDSWHSLMLAIRTIEQLLSYHSEDGAKLYYEKGGEALLLSDLIPRWVVSNEARKLT